MKKTLIRTIVIIILGIGALFLIPEDIRDRFNPLVKEKDVYVLVDKEGEQDSDFPGRYKFMLDGVDETGAVEKIKVGSSVKSFPENTYLKVRVKGKYVSKFDYIEEQEIPEQAKSILKK